MNYNSIFFIGILPELGMLSKICVWPIHDGCVKCKISTRWKFNIIQSEFPLVLHRWLQVAAEQLEYTESRQDVQSQFCSLQKKMVSKPAIFEKKKFNNNNDLVKSWYPILIVISINWKKIVQALISVFKISLSITRTYK